MRGQGRIYRRAGSPFLQVSCYWHGREYRWSTKTTSEREAQRFLRKKRKALEVRGRDHAEPGTIRMSQLFAQLEADMALRQIRSPKEIAAHFLPIKRYFGTYQARTVTPALMDTYIQERLLTRAPATVNWELQLLGQSLRLAVERQQLPRAPKVRRLPVQNARQGFFEPYELDALLPHLPAYLRDFTLFAYYTGWRFGEIQALEWRDVDMQAWTIRLRPEHAKNRMGRLIALHGPLVALVRSRWAQRALGDRIVAAVFHRKGHRIGDIRFSWHRACAAAGIGRKLFHDFRRTAVRNMVRAGVPERVAMQISGHKTRGIFDRYTIVSEADLHEAMAKVEAYMAGTARPVRRLREES